MPIWGEIMQGKDFLNLEAEDCVLVDNTLIFIAKNINIVFSFDINTGEIRVLDSIPEENIFAERLGAKIVYWKNELIFAPMEAEKIWIYDLEKHEWRGIFRKHMGYGSHVSEMFQAVLNGDKLIIIGSNYPAIISLNLQTEEVDYIEQPYARLREKQKQLGDCYFRCDYVRKNEYLYLASCLENLVLKFNMETYQYEWIEVGNATNRYVGITWDGENFWLAPRTNGTIVKWNEECSEEYVLPQEFQKDKIYFAGAVYNDGNVIFPGRFEPYTITLSTINPNIMEVTQEQYLFYKRIEGDLLVSQKTDGEIQIQDKTGAIKRYNCTMAKKEFTKYLERKKEAVFKSLSEKILQESQVMNIKDLCNILANENAVKKTQTEKEYVGGAIWQQLRN